MNFGFRFFDERNLFIKIFLTMKILMPVTENNASERSVARGFHNAQLVCLYDSGNQSVEWMSTKKFCASQGELGNELKNLGIDAIISYQMPLMALGFFIESGLKVYNAESSDIKECIQLFSTNHLQPLTHATCKTSSSCSSNCSSCSSISCKS